MVFLDYLEKIIRKRNYSELQDSFYKIRESKSVHRYVAKAILYSILIAVFTSSFCFVFSYFFLNLQLFYAIGLSLIIAGGLYFSVYRLFLYYPKGKATNRKKEIEDMLPHATAFMLALSKGGLEPIDIFESLSDKDEYGSIAQEAGAIARNAKVLGYSPTEAIEDVAETTSSSEFRDFLTSLSSVIETGADIAEFLSRRAERYYDWIEEKQEENLEFLGILSEVYVITLGLGPIFGIVILILFGMMGTFMPSLLDLIIYAFIPLGSALFIVILDMQSRTEFGESQHVEKKDSTSEESMLDYIGKKIEVSKNKFTYIQSFVRNPLPILWLTAPIGLFVFYVLFFSFGVGIESAVTFFTLVSFSPLAILYEIRRRRDLNLIKFAPDFLNSFSDALSSGLSPSKAIFFLTPDRFGRFGPEIEKVRRDIEWGSTVSEAFEKSAHRIKSGVISHIMSLVRKSSEAATDITQILEILSKDVSMERSLQQERTRITSTYVIIVFLTFVIFLLIAYSLTSSIVPLMGQMSQSGAEVGEMPVGDVGTIDPSVIENSFFRAALIHGFFSGLLAGMLRTGKISSGLKYSMIMLGIAWVFFIMMGI